MLWGRRVIQAVDCAPFRSWAGRPTMRLLLLLWYFSRMEQICKVWAVIHSSGKTHLPKAMMKKEGYYMFSLHYFYPSGFQLNRDLQLFGYGDPFIHQTEAPFESKTSFFKLKRKWVYMILYFRCSIFFHFNSIQSLSNRPGLSLNKTI